MKMAGPFSLENFCNHFHRLDAVKRVEICVSIVRMLHPVEIRYLGSLVEEQGRTCFALLRPLELKVNNVRDLKQCAEIKQHDDFQRSIEFFVSAIAVLHSVNYGAAHFLYKYVNHRLKASEFCTVYYVFI